MNTTTKTNEKVRWIRNTAMSAARAMTVLACGSLRCMLSFLWKGVFRIHTCVGVCSSVQSTKFNSQMYLPDRMDTRFGCQ